MRLRGADFETMPRETSRPAPGLELPPAAAPTAAMIDMLVAACARNHIDIIGLPLGRELGPGKGSFFRHKR